MNQKISLLLLVLVLAACQSQPLEGAATEEAPAGAEIAPDAPVTVVNEQAVPEIIDAETTAFAMVSPDGSAIAWPVQGLTVPVVLDEGVGVTGQQADEVL